VPNNSDDRIPDPQTRVSDKFLTSNDRAGEARAGTVTYDINPQNGDKRIGAADLVLFLRTPKSFANEHSFSMLNSAYKLFEAYKDAERLYDLVLVPVNFVS
jgi:hypothetical protein